MYVCCGWWRDRGWRDGIGMIVDRWDEGGTVWARMMKVEG
jgi:hypothetical protein